MNRYSQMTVILALVGGLALANTNFKESFAYTGTASEEKTLFGHFTLVVKDEFGKIKDYLEFDNVITDQGDGCIGTLVFAGATATCSGGIIDTIGLSDCSGPGTIDIGNTACGDAIGVAHGDGTTLFDETAGAGTGPDDCGDGSKAATSTFTARVVSPATPAKVRLSATFASADITGGFPFTAREAGILNTVGAACAEADQLFAIKAFADVALSGSDSITVNYDVSFSG